MKNKNFNVKMHNSNSSKNMHSCETEIYSNPSMNYACEIL